MGPGPTVSPAPPAPSVAVAPIVRRSEREPEPRPIAPPQGIPVRIGTRNVARSQSHVGGDIELEVLLGRLHALDDADQRGLGILRCPVVGKRLVIPAAVLLELVEPEWRLGKGGEHGPVPAGVVHHEGLVPAPSLELVLFAALYPLVVLRIEREHYT